jgi:hypothetical protein
MTWSLLAALLFPPIALGYSTRVRTSATIATVFVTWVAALIANYWFVPDPSDTGALVLFFLALGPAVAVPTAAVVATAFSPPIGLRVGAFLASAFCGLLGWAIGIVIMHVVTPFAARDDVWIRILGVSAPAIYCACGAVLAVSRPFSWLDRG